MSGWIKVVCILDRDAYELVYEQARDLIAQQLCSQHSEQVLNGIVLELLAADFLSGQGQFSQIVKLIMEKDREPSDENKSDVF